MCLIFIDLHSKQFLYTELLQLLHYVSSYLMSAAIETTIRLRHGLSKCQQPPGWKIDGKLAICANGLLDTRRFSCRRIQVGAMTVHLNLGRPRETYITRYLSRQIYRRWKQSSRNFFAAWTRAFARRGWV